MAHLEDIQRSIRNATDLYDVVRTMKILSAVSIHQYENAVRSLEQYYRTVEMGLQILLREEPHLPNVSPAAREEPQLGLIIIGSGQGMCGRFNEVLWEYTQARVQKMTYRWTHLMTAGTHINDLIDQSSLAVTQRLNVPSSVEGINGAVSEILVSLERWQQVPVHKVLLFYNRTDGPTNYSSRMQTLYPVDMKQFHRLKSQAWPTNMIPQFTMLQEDIMRAILRQYFFVSVYRAFAESLASEHASRLSSMQAAERKIRDRIDLLTAKFRQQRQNAITEEVLDIIASWESSLASSTT